MQRKQSLIKPIIAAVLIGLVALYIGAIVGIAISIDLFQMRTPPSETELPDQTILFNQKDLKEVKAFLSKYPNATKLVDRWSDSSGSMVVNYMVDNNAAKDKATGYVDGVWVGDYRALILRVFLGDDGKPQEMYVDCHDDEDSPRIYDNILNYIETETCLGI